MSRGTPSIRGLVSELAGPVLIAACLAMVGLFHVGVRVAGVNAGYRLSTLEYRGRTLEAEQARLRLERATLRRPDRLERLARTRLSMRPPPTGSVLPLARSIPTQVQVGGALADRGGEEVDKVPGER